MVFAPHPDDETFGMGGSMRLLSGSGKKIKVVVLTKGEKADPNTKDQQRYAEMRRQESLRAFQVLGVTDYEFLEFPDRELFGNFDKVVDAVKMIIDDFKPDVLFSPSIIELHPDHRATAEISIALKNNMPQLRCLLYEIVTPIRPSILVDITRVFRYKKKAIKCYKSQIKIMDYLGLMKTINRARSFTLGKGVKFAEAFWELNSGTTREDLRRWLCYETKMME